MKIVGITGGIGSGKSTAARMFGLLGGMIYYSDLHAKRIINTDPVKAQVVAKSTFGPSMLDKDGKIISSKIAEIIFNDPCELKWLNNVMYPYVMEDFRTWCEMWKDSDYCMIESAILVECDAHRECDVVINVTCPQDVRIKRAMQRDGSTKAQVMARINNQVQEDVRMAAADWIIWNNGTDTEYLQQQVNQIHKELTTK